MNRKLSGMLITALAFCLTISCSDKSTSDPTGLALNDSTAAESRVASATVTLAQPSLVVGQTTQATALLLDRYHNPLTLSVVWSSGDSAIATVSRSGLVTAKSSGSVSIVATRGYKSGAATLTVIPPPATVTSVTVDLAASSLTVGQTTRAMATLRDSSNNVVTGPAVVWTSSNASTATLTDSGMVTALAPGSTVISASAEGQIGTAPLAVTAPSPIPVASLTVSPASASLQIGATVQLQVSAFDSNNNPLTGRIVTSSSADPGIASVNSLGLVTAVSAGTTQITVTSEGKSAIATITVSAAAPPPPVKPSTVTGLQVSAIDNSSVTLSFTQVNDGTGQPAQYDVRYAVAPISWGSATSTTSGTCKTPVAGTAIGSQLSCTVLGLTPATNYNFQLIAFRGTLNLNAVFGGLSNIVGATTTSSAPPPPPPPSGGSAEPPGMTVLTDRPFNAVSELGWGGAWDEGGGGGPANFSITTDATAPKSPSSVGQMKFPVGLVGGYPPAVVGTSFSGSSRTLYVAMWVKLSTNWVGNAGAGGAKISHVWINGVNRLYTYVDGVSGPLSPWVNLQQLASSYDPRPQGGQGSGGSVNLPPNIAGQTGVKIIRGQWHKWEVVMYGGNAGSADGTVDWWIDGVKVGHYTGIPFVSSGGSNTWDMIEWNPTWGGLGGTISAVQYQWMDHMYISGKP